MNTPSVFESTTFQFSIFVLAVAALAVAFSDGITWKDWLESAVYFVGIYAGKEGVRYGSNAYKGKSQ